jgi:hypothetical protein
VRLPRDDHRHGAAKILERTENSNKMLNDTNGTPFFLPKVAKSAMWIADLQMPIPE